MNSPVQVAHSLIGVESAPGGEERGVGMRRAKILEQQSAAASGIPAQRLAPLGITDIPMPAIPERIRRAIREHAS